MMLGKIVGWKQGERLVRYTSNESMVNQSDTMQIVPHDGLKIKIGDKTFVYQVKNIEEKEYYENDVFQISETGEITKVYSSKNQEVDIFITNKCNSNCVMCPLPENVRRKKQLQQSSWIKSYIRALPEEIGYINVTGGEPTLAKEELFSILSLLKQKYQHSGYQLLTNGRSASDKKFLQQLLKYIPNGMRFAIPLHSAIESVHDEITNVRGSFKQTDQGIKNLLQSGQKVEIRIVVSRKNIDTMEETARYIRKYYQGVFCVNFIAMEMMGNAAVHKNELWMDYPEAFQRIKKAIAILIHGGIDVQLYNFPLCAVEHGYWYLAVKSITEHKIRYMEECTSCVVKNICGGFFVSTKTLMKPEVKPIIGEYK